MLKQSFKPIIGLNAHTLILGSLPGDRSIAMQQYYGHKQNRFWPLMHLLFNVDVLAEYEKRVECIKEAGIAIWDVAFTAQRAGSLDAAITQESPNEIIELVNRHTSIKRVCFNGQKAAAMYKKHLPYLNNISYITLPSTSPANASVKLPELARLWRSAILL